MRGRCEPIRGRYFRHLTAMDGGNAGNYLPALAKDPRYELLDTMPRSREKGLSSIRGTYVVPFRM